MPSREPVYRVRIKDYFKEPDCHLVLCDTCPKCQGSGKVEDGECAECCGRAAQSPLCYYPGVIQTFPTTKGD